MPAKATVVVFRRSDPESRPISLTLVSPGIYRLDVLQPELESVRKRFLPACTWVAVVVDGGVRWLHVGNSWSTYTKAGRTRADKKPEKAFVSFSDPDVAEEASQGNALTVYAFVGVLKLEEHLVSLE
jgi:hypothetical protein